TILNIATCEAIIDHGAPDPAAIAQKLGALYCTGALTGAGASTVKAAQELSHGGRWALGGRKGAIAAGNGAARRMVPLAFFLNPSDPDQRRTIRDVCRITHHSDEAYAGALAIVLSIRSAWDGSWPTESPLTGLLNQLPDTSVRDRLAELAALDPNTYLSAIDKKFRASGS